MVLSGWNVLYFTRHLFWRFWFIVTLFFWRLHCVIFHGGGRIDEFLHAEWANGGVSVIINHLVYRHGFFFQIGRLGCKTQVCFWGGVGLLITSLRVYRVRRGSQPSGCFVYMS
ncbi:hypothetical protein P153DRAFT_230745 [Dothidotthia symphoricarpi CBS 119687]|uniref:Uncharacterized protein n=1 Tax=Dothidotthia symphoricarpi CBS 119687 TaxID=1392245 RepID=A0A6A6AGS4_9PLEO|nr:uncharacterized protein P153DRAFT_230745 [Dothidotthia symphoricarpi CBS 119687]KAF2130097.1 hypothetical protein P153DRAFT_230745 [Dothidotthia symphoricarpi CBS 119687]